MPGMPVTHAGPCVPACVTGEVCDPRSGSCYECTSSGDCEVPDECDDCAPTDTVCIEAFCTACTTDNDCPPGEPRCRQSRCRELEI